MPNRKFSLEVRPRIPDALEGLNQLADDLIYSWDRDIRALFRRLDNALFERCGENPRILLRRVSQKRLEEAAGDDGFLGSYKRALAAYEAYQTQGISSRVTELLDPARELIAFFCLEFGLHESVPFYSGGLGILAGDYCKAASDLGIPFVAVGLLYRQGYFDQTINEHGHQVAGYHPTPFEDVPVHQVRDDDGNEVVVDVEVADARVRLNVWKARIGRIDLYLLDSDHPENDKDHRSITYQLYGGDNVSRIRQEIVLGIGGVRALHAVGLNPTVWHINEGHAAFLILERCRRLVELGYDFESALEEVAAGTVFTTHTPVAAGHDVFDHALARPYLDRLAAGLEIDVRTLAALGDSMGNGGFNMTALALRGSRAQNGVSEIHGALASRMEAHVWPQIEPSENPIRYVTNGVHLPTFLAHAWCSLFDGRFADWRNELLNPEFWACIDEIPDQLFWSMRGELKAQMLKSVHERLLLQHRRNGVAEANIRRICRLVEEYDSDLLVLGFARRFATYKRAGLLFTERERLARIVRDSERPVLIVIAGSAHPDDQPGQELIRQIHEISMSDDFIGNVLLLEGYGLALARPLVAGVDVWLNTPQHPLEACGTSGQKAAMNGVLNLSVLDGWWAEAFDGSNGWGIHPRDPRMDAGERDRQEARELLDLLEQEVVPLYYERDATGVSPEWVQFAKASMKTAIPRFNAQRMAIDYVRDFYAPARDHAAALSKDGGLGARNLAAWKRKVVAHWDGVSIRAAHSPAQSITQNESFVFEMEANLNGLAPSDVVVELIFVDDDDEIVEHHALSPSGGEHSTTFRFDYHPTEAGLHQFKVRMFPHHPLLSHPHEMGRMIWLETMV